MSMTHEEWYRAYKDGSIDAVEYLTNYAAIRLQQYMSDNLYGITTAESTDLVRFWLLRLIDDERLDIDDCGLDKAVKSAIDICT